MSLAAYLHRPSLNPYSIHSRSNNDALPGTRSGRSRPMQPSRISTSRSKLPTDPSLWVDRDLVSYVRSHYERADATSLTALIHDFRLSPLGLWYLQTDEEELLRLANDDVSLKDLVLDLASHVRPTVSPTTPRRRHVKQLSKDLDVPTPPPPPPPPVEEEPEPEEEDEDLARSVVSDWALDEMPEEGFEPAAHEYTPNPHDYQEEGDVEGLGLHTEGAADETFRAEEPVPPEEADLLDLGGEEGASDVPIHDNFPSDDAAEHTFTQDQLFGEEDASEDVARSVPFDDEDFFAGGDGSYEPSKDDETEAAHGEPAYEAAASIAEVAPAAEPTAAEDEESPSHQDEHEQGGREEKEDEQLSGETVEDPAEAEEPKPVSLGEEAAADPEGLAAEDPEEPATEPAASSEDAATEDAPQPTASTAEVHAAEEPEQAEEPTPAPPVTSTEEEDLSAHVGDAAASGGTHVAPDAVEQSDAAIPAEGAAPSTPTAQSEEDAPPAPEAPPAQSWFPEEETTEETGTEQQSSTPEATAEDPTSTEDGKDAEPEPELQPEASSETQAQAEGAQSQAPEDCEQEAKVPEGSEQKTSGDSVSVSKAAEDASSSQEPQSLHPAGSEDSSTGGKPTLTLSVPPPPAASSSPPPAQTPASVFSQPAQAPATPRTPAWGGAARSAWGSAKSFAWGSAQGPASIFSSRPADKTPAQSPSVSSKPAVVWGSGGMAASLRKASAPSPAQAPPSPSPWPSPPVPAPLLPAASSAGESGAILTSPAPEDAEKPTVAEEPQSADDAAGAGAQQDKKESTSDPDTGDVKDLVSSAMEDSVLEDTSKAESSEQTETSIPAPREDGEGESRESGEAETEKLDGEFELVDDAGEAAGTADDAAGGTSGDGPGVGSDDEQEQPSDPAGKQREEGEPEERGEEQEEGEEEDAEDSGFVLSGSTRGSRPKLSRASSSNADSSTPATPKTSRAHSRVADLFQDHTRSSTATSAASGESDPAPAPAAGSLGTEDEAPELPTPILSPADKRAAKKKRQAERQAEEKRRKEEQERLEQEKRQEDNKNKSPQEEKDEWATAPRTKKNKRGNR